MGQRIGLNPDHIRIANQLRIGNDRPIHEANIRQLWLDLPGPGIVPTEDNNPLCCVTREPNLWGGRFNGLARAGTDAVCRIRR